MKKLIAFSLLLALVLSGCGTAEEPSPPPESGTPVPSQMASPEVSASPSETQPEPPVGQSETPGSSSDRSGGVLIAYFSIPEDVDPAGVDAVSGASIVVRNGETLGNTQYVAQIIQETIGGDLFAIETVQQYPLDHDPLVDQASDEKAANARPELASHIENLDQFDTILLGYPNWWADLPMPLYTFLEEYDLSGKTIIPFVTHGGSRASRTAETIAQLQPNATVWSDPLVLSRNDVAGSADQVTAWAESLNLNK